mgnify:CR=1 FL=1
MVESWEKVRIKWKKLEKNCDFVIWKRIGMFLCQKRNNRNGIIFGDLPEKEYGGVYGLGVVISGFSGGNLFCSFTFGLVLEKTSAKYEYT